MQSHPSDVPNIREFLLGLESLTFPGPGLAFTAMLHLVPIILAAGEGDAFFMGLLLLAALVALFMAFMWFRKWFKAEQETTADEPFSLEDLRQMLQDGRLTQDEFTRLKDQMIATLKPKERQKPAPPMGP